MCGVIGVHLPKVRAVHDARLALVENLFLQSMIRGKHATGVTFLKQGKLTTIKEGISADKFMEKHNVADWVDGDSLTLIGHIRYSTSDLRHNQPFQGREMAIAHNGVISQDPDVWEYETETQNDSELILRCIEAGDTPLEAYRERSMAVTAIDVDGNLSGWRNHERPLWMATDIGGLIFASTSDIIERSGMGEAVKCDPMVRYIYNDYSGLVEDRTYFSENDMLVDLQ